MLPLHDSVPAHKTPFVTYGIILISLYVLFLEFSSANLELFFQQWALIPAKLDFSNVETLYPLITATFLHGGILHFASNMWFLHIFGDNVEDHLGHVTYLLFYLGGGVVASLAQYFWVSDSIIPMLGASGAIAAVLGYYYVKFPNHKIETLIPLFFVFFTARLNAKVVLFFWFITQLFNGTMSLGAPTSAQAGVAWWAHIGGFVFGYIVAQLVGNSKPKPKRGVVVADEILYG